MLGVTIKNLHTK